MALPVAAIAAGASGLTKILGGVFGSRKRKREQRRARKEVQKYKDQYMNLDTSNLWENQENVYEDQTVNLQEAQFLSEQQQMGLASTLAGLNQVDRD